MPYTNLLAGVATDADGDALTYSKIPASFDGPGSDWLTVSTNGALSGLPGTSPGTVVVIGLQETDPVEDVLESMLELSGAGELVEDENVAGRWMTSVVPPDVGLQPSWAFLDEALLFSLQAEPVRAVLAQAGEDAPPGWLAAQTEEPFADGGAFGAAFCFTLQAGRTQRVFYRSANKR